MKHIIYAVLVVCFIANGILLSQPVIQSNVNPTVPSTTSAEDAQKLLAEQQRIADSIKIARQWKPSGITGANISQVYFKDWVQGGDNSLAWNIFLNLGLDKEWESWKLKNQLKTIYGMMKLGDLQFRGNENEFFLENLLAYKLKWKLDPYFSNTIQTLLLDAYTYTDSTSELVSTFFDPGYITQSLGFMFDDEAGFTFRIGAALKETFTNRFRSFSNNGDPNGEKTFLFETGLESVITYKKQIMENIIYDGRLRAFSRFNSLDVWDVRFDNNIAAKINKYISVNFTAIIIHEIAQTRRTQLKQGLQIGLSYLIF